MGKNFFATKGGDEYFLAMNGALGRLNCGLGTLLAEWPISRRVGFQLGCAIGMILLMTGCATTRIDWQSRVGAYTYDQAVLELGPPDKIATLTDGTKVGEWLMHRGSRSGGFTSVGGPYMGGPYYYGGPFYHHYSEPAMPDQFLRLTFGADGILKSWQRVAK